MRLAMISPFVTILSLALLAMLIAPSRSFAPLREISGRRLNRSFIVDNELPVSQKSNLQSPKLWIALATAATVSLVPSQVLAAAVDQEVAELPPPYIPVIFAIAMIGGVGWLTSSLGNVMDEEASLGLQSGARAKKERERSSSSYFKKK